MANLFRIPLAAHRAADRLEPFYDVRGLPLMVLQRNMNKTLNSML
jgi:hypothetical protein